MAEIFVPTVHTFAMENGFTGSYGAFRYKIDPNVVKKSAKDVDMDASSITCKFWHGPFCYEKSTVEGEQTFPMSEEGRAAMKAWLEANV